MNEKKRHTILDLQVMNKFCKFNHEFNKWMNEVCSRNVRNTIGKDIRQLLHDARCELVKALGLEVSLFPVEKYHCFNKAQCLLYSVQLDLNDLNDDGTLSNDGKARLDMLLDLRYIETWLWDELHIRLHPNKRYLQHYSKGIEFLGYKLRFNRILPSDRVVHNYKYKVDCEIRRADRERPKDLEHFMQTVNSYNGMLKWCNARRLQKEVMDKIRNSRLAKYYDIAEDNSKILIKPQYTRVEYYKRKNQERKKQWTGVR